MIVKIKGELPAAAADVLAERKRQIEFEGYDTFHDDSHGDGSLARAAICYALPLRLRGKSRVPTIWPRSWLRKHWKPKDRRRDLVRAAALLIAEIERLDRLAGRA